MGERRGMKALELWCRRITDSYPGVKVENMTTSWRDGLAFCALIHHFRPDLIDFDRLDKREIFKNNELAFRIAERHLGIPALLDAEDMVEYEVPDRLSILTYLSQFYQTFVGSQRATPSPSRSRTSVSDIPDSPPQKVGPGRLDSCWSCNKPVFLAQRLVVGGKLRHRACFTCARCGHQLNLAGYYETEAGAYVCETCPDEEDKCKAVRNLSLSDDEKQNTKDEYSLHFESALDEQQLTEPTSFSNVSLVKSRLKMFETSDQISNEQLVNDIINQIENDEGETKKLGTQLQNDIEQLQEDIGKIQIDEQNSKEVIAEPQEDIGKINIEDTRRQEFLRNLLEDNFEDAIEDVNVKKEPDKDSGFIIEEEVEDEEVDELKPTTSKESETFEQELNNKENTDNSKGCTVSSTLEESEQSYGSMSSSKDIFDVKMIVDEQSTEDTTEKIASPTEIIEDTTEITAPTTEIIEDTTEITAPTTEIIEDTTEITASTTAIIKDTIEKIASTTEIIEDTTEITEDTTKMIAPTTEITEDTTAIIDESDDKEDSSCLKLVNECSDTDHVNTNNISASVSDSSPMISPQEKIVKPLDIIVNKEDYPDDLNPFGEDEEGEEGDIQPPKPTPRKRPPVSPRRNKDGKKIIVAPVTHYNPFWSDGEPSSEEDTPKPLPRKSIKTPESSPKATPHSSKYGSTTSLSSLCSTASGTKKKKRLAPPPPPLSFETTSSSGSLSLSVSPGSTLRRRKSRPAPPPPTFLAKYEKDEENKMKQNLPDKSTYGQWKRKKGPAPSVPVPQKRRIVPLPLVDIKRELEDLEIQQSELERQGVSLEQTIRLYEEENMKDPTAEGKDIEGLILQLFELVNEKNELFRRQAELMYLKRQQRLEEEYADIEYQIRCLMVQPECNKTDTDKAHEEELIRRLVGIVERRNEIIDSLDMDRRREAEEDKSIHQHMENYAAKGQIEEVQKEPHKKHSSKSILKLIKKKKKKDKKEKEQENEKDIDESLTPVSQHEKTKTLKFKKKWF